MGRIVETASGLLRSGEVEVVIGFSEGSNGRVRPFFAKTEEQAGEFIWDERCDRNLAVYIYRKETAGLGKPAVFAGTGTLRSIIRLAAEKQIADGDVAAIYVSPDGGAEVFKTLDGIEKKLEELQPAPDPADMKLLDELRAMTPRQRWEFWQSEMENCIKCYACRQACPLCYCTRCTVEVNQPQWISVGAGKLGNLEWHVMRAMHLAGRCVECGQCGKACPTGIPIHLLPISLAQDMRREYGLAAGMKRDEGCAMATFSPGDKENFIG